MMQATSRFTLWIVDNEGLAAGWADCGGRNRFGNFSSEAGRQLVLIRFLSDGGSARGRLK